MGSCNYDGCSSWPQECTRKDQSQGGGRSFVQDRSFSSGWSGWVGQEEWTRGRWEPPSAQPPPLPPLGSSLSGRVGPPGGKAGGTDLDGLIIRPPPLPPLGSSLSGRVGPPGCRSSAGVVRSLLSSAIVFSLSFAFRGILSPGLTNLMDASPGHLWADCVTPS